MIKSAFAVLRCYYCNAYNSMYTAQLELPHNGLTPGFFFYSVAFPAEYIP
jgi:hypothetical protein